jgi:glycosyltransferase involved in cell wall biosynthesis
MKITFVLATVNMSGGNRVIAIYAQMLADRGHQVVLVSMPLPQPSWAERIRSWLAGRPADRPAGSHSHMDALTVEHRVLPAWRPVTDADVPDADVVIATWWETAEWVAALSPTKGRKFYFVQHHEVFDYLPVERARATYRLPLRKIVVAQWLRRVMATEYGDADVDLVSNSVDHAQFFAAPRGKAPVPTVGFLYSSAEFKGVDVTLRALALLRERVPNLRVLSFGMEWPVADAAAALSFSFNPPQATLREIYAGCDAWLTASRSEGFNLPAMEAMACRTPVVSTRAGWPEEAIVERVNGMLVDVDDAVALMEGAHWVLSLDDAAWRAASQAAFDTVRASSWEASTAAFEAALSRGGTAADTR